MNTERELMSPEERQVSDDARMTRMEQDIKSINSNVAKLYTAVEGVTTGDRVWHETMCEPNRVKIVEMEKDIATIDKQQASKWPMLFTSFAGSVSGAIVLGGVVFAIYKGAVGP